jgi:hypothetical protein
MIYFENIKINSWPLVPFLVLPAPRQMPLVSFLKANLDKEKAAQVAA